MNKKIVPYILFLALSIFIVACNSKADKPETSSEKSSKIILEKEEEEHKVIDTVEEKQDKEIYRSFLTGLKIKKKDYGKRPFAYMFNNIKYAYPQTGTERAKIIYEILAEGGITRLMGVFENMEGDRIGSARSVRHYYVDFAKEFDAILIHFGQTHYAIDEIKKLGVDTLSGLSAEGYTVFYRDKNIPAPHNAFASSDGIYKAVKDKNYRLDLKNGIGEHFKFSDEEEVVNKTGKKASYVTVPFSSYMSPYFVYDKKTKKYTRYAFMKEHIDRGTGKPLKFKNIFIQLVNEYNIDKNGYQTMDLVGSGRGYYITDNIVIPVYWSKNSKEDKTRFYYDKEEKEELRVNRGKSYYAVFPLNREDKLRFNK